MTLVPHRTVAAQIAALLRSEISRGRYGAFLPSERDLCLVVQSNRKTIRAAIQQLKAEGLVETCRGIGNRIIAPQPRRAERLRKTIGLLLPGPLSSLRPFQICWIDELKQMLGRENCELEIHAGQQFYRAHPERALQRLVADHRHEAWLLVFSSRAMQLWFQCKRVPCLIAGSVHADLALPFCDLDFQAVCRHAVGVLHRLGHRRIALLSHTDRWAGEINSELGFMEGARAISGGAIIGTIRRHEEGAQSLAQALKSLLHGSERPTGIIVSSSYVYLTVAGLLAQNGLRIPQDVSLISRDDDPFLEAVVPSPTRYASNSRRFARKVLGSLLQLARGQTVTPHGTYLLPKLIIGDSTTRVK